ncbi:MAG: hypothetical protein D6782_08320 [Alphaproteobacteria bacterium]|nr:MAG: hypothetical protein D6782_08320 [Alphaproteobacteria bacterium]
MQTDHFSGLVHRPMPLIRHVHDDPLPVGEIDLVCTRKGVLVFVEVKARPHLDDAAAAITPRQLARIRRAAAHFRARHPRLGMLDCRIDALLVAPLRLPRHLRDIA